MRSAHRASTAAAALIGLGVAAAPAGAFTPEVVEGRSVDGVAIGMTRAQAVARLGQPASCSGVHTLGSKVYQCTFGRIGTTIRLYITLKGGRVAYFTVSQRFHLTSGIRALDSEAKVKRAYGRRYVPGPDPGQPGAATTGSVVGKVGGQWRRTTFYFTAGRVALLMVNRTYVPRVSISPGLAKGGGTVTYRISGLPAKMRVGWNYGLAAVKGGERMVPASGRLTVTLSLDERTFDAIDRSTDEPLTSLPFTVGWKAPIGGVPETVKLGSARIALAKPPTVTAIEPQPIAPGAPMRLHLANVERYGARELVLSLDDPCANGELIGDSFGRKPDAKGEQVVEIAPFGTLRGVIERACLKTSGPTTLKFVVCKEIPTPTDFRCAPLARTSAVFTSAPQPRLAARGGR